MSEDLSLSDIASVCGNGDFGNNSWIVLILLFAMIYGGGGFFGNQNANDAATTADIQRAVDLNGIQQGQANIAAELQRGINEVNSNTNHNAYDTLGEIRDVQASVASNGSNIINALTQMQQAQQTCCCETQRAIDNVNYNLATQSAAIQANSTAQAQKILDAVATNRMADMQSQISALQLQLATAGTVKYPNASTYYAGSNPFCGAANSAF